MNKRVLVALWVLAVAWTGCMEPKTDIAAVRKRVEDAAAVFSSGFVAGEVDRIAALYAENAVSMPPNASALMGRTAIADYLRGIGAQGIVIRKANFSVLDFDVSGKLAFERGSYQMTMDIPVLGQQDDDGKYIAVWKQEADGEWRIYSDIWNSNIPVVGLGENK